MERGALLLALLALAAPFAGCLGGDEAPTAERAGPAADVVAPTLATGGDGASADVPTWSVGDAWSIVPQGDAQDAPSVLVVTAAGPDGYTVSTTSEGTAGYDALHDVSYLGRIRASDLAGSQEGQPVQFFSFPLADGKTWQTTWDGRAITLTATFVPALTTSAGIHEGFAIEGRDGDQVYVKYDYVPTLKWWSHLSFASGYGFKVERVHAGWTGAYLQAEAKTLLDKTTPAPVASPFVETFVVDEGAAFVSVSLTGAASASARLLVLLDPEGQLHPTSGATGAAGAGPVDGEERLPPTPGEWRLAAPVAHHPDGSFHLLVRQVTLVPVSFP